MHRHLLGRNTCLQLFLEKVVVIAVPFTVVVDTMQLSRPAVRPKEGHNRIKLSSIHSAQLAVVQHEPSGDSMNCDLWRPPVPQPARQKLRLTMGVYRFFAS